MNISGANHYFSFSPYERIIGFSRAIRSGNHFYIAGTASIGPDGTTIYPNDAAGQMEYCITQAQKAIEAVGGTLKDVTRTRILLTSINDWEVTAVVHERFFANIRPVCTVMEVSRFIRGDWKVELEAEGIIVDH